MLKSDTIRLLCWIVGPSDNRCTTYRRVCRCRRRRCSLGLDLRLEFSGAILRHSGLGRRRRSRHRALLLLRLIDVDAALEVGHGGLDGGLEVRLDLGAVVDEGLGGGLI